MNSTALLAVWLLKERLARRQVLGIALALAGAALVALGTGGLFGVGLGASRARWSFLPNAHTDFIFSIVGEETGLAGSLAVVLLFVGSQAALWWQQSRAERALDAQIAEIFAQARPGQPVVDARAQMQGALGTGGAAGGGLLPAITVIAQAMAQAPAARLKSVSFRNNVIELDLTAPSIETHDGIKQGMNRDGFTAEIQSANPNGRWSMAACS